jgi:hypothetical protein
MSHSTSWPSPSAPNTTRSLYGVAVVPSFLNRSSTARVAQARWPARSPDSSCRRRQAQRCPRAARWTGSWTRSRRSSALCLARAPAWSQRTAARALLAGVDEQNRAEQRREGAEKNKQSQRRAEQCSLEPRLATARSLPTTQSGMRHKLLFL